MTPARQQQLLQNQSSLARKVYEAVPTIEPWAASRIKSALDGNHAFAVISGVLADLKKQGLIKEVSRLRFIRVEVKATLADQMRAIQEELQTKDAEPMQQQKPPARNPHTPVDNDHREAQRAFALAQQLEDEVMDLRPLPGDPAIYADEPAPLGTADTKCITMTCLNPAAPDVRYSGMCAECYQKDCEGGVEQAQEMADNMAKYGTIDVPAAGKPASAFDKLFELSQKVRSTAAAHHNAMAELADGLEAVAVEIGAEHEANAERTEQLRKLKLALNAIGDL